MNDSNDFNLNNSSYNNINQPSEIDLKRDEIYLRAGDDRTILGRTNDQAQVLSFVLFEILNKINQASDLNELKTLLKPTQEIFKPLHNIDDTTIKTKGLSNIIERFNATSKAITKALHNSQLKKEQKK